MSENLWRIIKLIYRHIFRQLLLNAIDDPESEIDDFVMRLLDNLFEYEPSN